jgi:hypothetical protein
VGVIVGEDVGDGVSEGVNVGDGVSVRVSVGIGVLTDPQATRIKDNNKNSEICFDIIHDLLCKELPNGLRYPRWGGRRNAVRLEKC